MGAVGADAENVLQAELVVGILAGAVVVILQAQSANSLFDQSTIRL
jgi:hypothetical protein